MESTQRTIGEQSYMMDTISLINDQILQVTIKRETKLEVYIIKYFPNNPKVKREKLPKLNLVLIDTHPLCR